MKESDYITKVVLTKEENIPSSYGVKTFHLTTQGTKINSILLS